MRTLFAILNHPIVVLISAVSSGAMLTYLGTVAAQALYWFLPCIAIIIADLVSGVSAAKYRGERITFSAALRRTVNKSLCYAAWVIFCVCCNQMYETNWCAMGGMGIVFFIEGVSFISNVLEPRGMQISLKALLSLVGNKLNTEGLENIIEPKSEIDGTEA